MTSYYNEFDKQCVEVLQRQIELGALPAGFVDHRSILEVQPNDIRNYNEAHFFAGIGGLSLGFARAAIPSNVTVWTGGFPCQDLSIAGKRAGLAGQRSGLYFKFHELITANYPEWVVLENVPGLLSSNEGRDFAIVIGGLTGIVPEVPAEGWGNAGLFRGPVYNVAYRILDAQYFGVPQRRRRVFIVASLGSGRAAEVLFEREGVPGDIAPSREAGERTPQTTIVNFANGGANQNNVKVTDTMDTIDTWMTFAVMAHGQAGAEIVNDGEPSLTLNHEAPILFDGRNMDTHNQSPTLQAKKEGYSLNYTPMVAYNIMPQNSGRDYKAKETNISQNLTTNGNHSGDQGGTYIVPASGVRRLTPTECARLQGFPDDWNAWLSDTVRYRQFGNAVAVPVAEWIGRRIMEAA